MNGPWRILVVDDERVMRQSMAAWLREDGYVVDVATSGPEAIDKARESDYAVCFIDLKMPGGPDGIETMVAIRKMRPEAAAVIITAYATVDTAISAMKEGAHDYIVKPCNPQEISLLVQRLLRLKRLEQENISLRKKLERQYRFHDIISKNARMAEIFSLVRDLAGLRSTVLIQGESGTGKELVARAIHREGSSADKPFVAVPCAALAETLLESELFGHERGAFTGATSQRKGKVELADGGTLFLDEIGDISPKLQRDLLRFLQERTFFRVGGTKEMSVDLRVIAATHADLRRAVREGTFRQDLFYRLNVVAIHLPPLRERRDDIPLLAESFLKSAAHEAGKEISELSAGAVRVLVDHDWPGNVRELENAVERAVVTAHGKVLEEHDFAFLAAGREEGRAWEPPSDMTLSEVEKHTIEAVLRRTDGNIRRSAAILGIDRSTLYEKLKRHDIERPGARARDPE